ncbi:MAG: hypothetical protein J6Y22_08240 [Paludibacteraceae bacterium]|nr:hypothetical protein [Paludibacteraceae bacterium]
MKKRIVSLLLCAVSIGAYAQQKGDMFLGLHGGVGLTSSNVSYEIKDKKNLYDETLKDSNPNVDFFIAPGFHYFFANNLRIGLDFTFGITKEHLEYAVETTSFTSDTKSKYWSVGPVFAGYVKLAEKFYYVPELDLNYIRMKVDENAVYMYKKQYVSYTILPEEYRNEPLDNISNVGAYKTDGKPVNGFSSTLRLLQFEFRPTERLGFSMSLIDFSFTHIFRKGEDAHAYGIDYHIPNVKNNNLQIGVNPAVGIYIYF